MSNQHTFLVIGLGTLGHQSAVALSERGASVLAVERNRERVDHIAHLVTKAIALDANDEDALATVGAFEADTALVCLGDFFDSTVLVTHMLRRRGVTNVVAQVNSQRQAEAIRAVGATQVVFPERDIARELVDRFLAQPLPFERITIGKDAGIIEVPVGDVAAGKSLRDLELRARYHVNVIGVKSPADEEGLEEPISLTPDADEPLNATQTLVILGHNHHLQRFHEQFPRKG
jgi:trk system potassium uptake protein